MNDRCIDCHYLEELGQTSPDDYRNRFVCRFHKNNDGSNVSVNFPREQSCGTDFLSKEAGYRDKRLEKLLNE